MVKAVYAKREGGFLLLHIVQVSSTLHLKIFKYFLNHLREHQIWHLNHHVIVGLVADRVGRMVAILNGRTFGEMGRFLVLHIAQGSRK